MSSGHVCIVAHFHDVGEVTFESDDTSTAQEKYNQYISEHPLKESSDTEIGDFTVYHAAVEGHYTYCNARRWAYRGQNNGEYTHQCEVCGYTFTGKNISYDYDMPHVTGYVPGQAAYYTPSCGHSDGEVLRVEVIF